MLLIASSIQRLVGILRLILLMAFCGDEAGSPVSPQNDYAYPIGKIFFHPFPLIWTA
jgi:hypothetical protein